jgi:hypothetical protein
MVTTAACFAMTMSSSIDYGDAVFPVSGMACTLSWCPLPAYLLTGQEHGRTIPLPDLTDPKNRLAFRTEQPPQQSDCQRGPCELREDEPRRINRPDAGERIAQ